MFAVLLICSLAYSIMADRPKTILNFEEECFESHGGFMENLQWKVSDFVGIARHRLGIMTPTENLAKDRRIKKCEYYHCLLKKLNMTNEYDMPDLAQTELSISENYKDAAINKNLMHHCFNSLLTILSMKDSGERHEDRQILITEVNGEAKEVAISPGDTIININSSKLGSKLPCELSRNLVQCLGGTQPNLFQFP